MSSLKTLNPVKNGRNLRKSTILMQFHYGAIDQVTVYTGFEHAVGWKKWVWGFERCSFICEKMQKNAIKIKIIGLEVFEKSSFDVFFKSDWQIGNLKKLFKLIWPLNLPQFWKKL